MLDEGFQSRIWNQIADIVVKLNIDAYFIVGRPLSSPIGYDKQHHIIYSLINRQNIDGLIIFAGTLGNFISIDQLTSFCNHFKPIPMVCLSQSINGIPSIIVDNRSGIVEIMDHLIAEHGYKKIAFII